MAHEKIEAVVEKPAVRERQREGVRFKPDPEKHARYREFVQVYGNLARVALGR